MDNILAAKQVLDNYDARVPKDNERVYKDECLYSFDSPVSPTSYLLHKFSYYILKYRNCRNC